MFVAFEGIDGSGKTTLASAYARTKNFHYTHTPSFSSEEADRLNLHSLDTTGREAVFLMDRIEHQKELRKYPDIVCDRYIWSALAYSYTFNHFIWPFLEAVYAHKYFLKPFVYVWVDTDPHLCKDRGVVQDYEKLKALREAYAACRPKIQESQIIVVDGAGPLDENLKVIMKKLGEIDPYLGGNVTQTNLIFEGF